MYQSIQNSELELLNFRDTQTWWFKINSVQTDIVLTQISHLKAIDFKQGLGLTIQSYSSFDAMADGEQMIEV